MTGAFYNGISGVRTHQFGIDSTSNNIANINTIGYRANLPEFKTLFARSMDYVNANSPISNDYNYGSTIGSNAINANDGSYVNAEGDFNVAYSGKGWFVVGLNKNGAFDINAPVYNGTQRNYFTRDGSFSLDGEGYLVNSSGYYMYGINLGKIAADGTLNGTNNMEADFARLAGSNLQPLQIPKNLNYKPTLTTEVGLSINLNRTQNPKGIGILQDETGVFSMEKFLAQDLNALMNAKGELLDPRNYKDLNISLERGGITTKYTFTYGAEENGFRTMGELINLIKAQTGLNLGLKLDSEGNPSDCSLSLSNGGMQDVRVSVNGRLADKLGLKASGSSLESAFSGVIRNFTENTEYQDQEYVRYEGMIFQKNGEDAAAGNPLDNPESWTLVDTSGVALYQDAQAADYTQGTLIVSEGKVYRKLTDEVTEITDPETNEVSIATPAEDAANWEEVADFVLGEVGEYAEGATYAQDSVVSYNGILYRKVNGAGNTNPIEDSEGWRVLNVASLSSTQLQIPTYETNTEIFSDSGEKFILKNQYILVEQANRNVTPEVLERWEVRSSIYNSVGEIRLSENLVINEITFNGDGSANGGIFEVPFDGGNVRVDLTQSADGKTTSNFAYADSEIKSTTQDGTEAGIMKDIVIDDNGIILVNFTNGKVEPIGRFGIAAFVNDQGLSKVGGNLFEMNARTINGETAVVSGPPLLAWEENGWANLKFGRVLDHMLETSNADTGVSLTDLIVYQRGYQMSAKSITTADQLMQEAIQLKRN